MSDRVSKRERSALMRSVKREHTKPELLVRKAAFRCGLRFRLHSKKLPGRPDLVFTKHRVCLVVHGCFWHRHRSCSRATTPKSNLHYWSEKFAENIVRDRRVQRA